MYSKLARVLGAILLWIALAVGRGPAARAESQDFQRAISEAVAHFEAGRFEEARRAFTEAHALAPSARTLRALGMVAFELHDYVESVTYLEEALRATVKPLDGSLRREAEGVLARARKQTARLSLALTPASAGVVLDGVPVNARDQPLTLSPGRHELALSASGHQAERRTLELAAGEERSLTIALAPALAVESASAASKSERTLYKNPWLWSAVGVATVALVTGLAVGLSRRDDTRTAPAYGGDTDAVLTGP